MRIALITMHAVDNYGSTLQTYATVKKLKDLGHDVEIVDYRIPVPISFVKKILLYPKHLKFERFRETYLDCISMPYRSLSDLQKNPPIADCYLVGSDMVWNSEITKETAKAFFLDFGEKDTIRAAYAPSFGMLQWEDSEWLTKDVASELLHKIQLLSVRESFGIDILKNDFDIYSATQVVDPTLLYDSYPELTGNIPQTEDLIIYKLMADCPEFYEKAKQIAKDFRITPRSIGSIRRIKGIVCGYPEGVEGWIRRIGGAKFVMTDSFHGTIFSILYRRQFILYAKSPKLTSRMRSILQLLGLESRIVTGDSSATDIEKVLQEQIDYKQVSERLEVQRKISNNFLSRISESV
jgi:hypothetical protein